MKKSIVFALSTAGALSLQAAVKPAEVAPKEVLFLAHFNHSVKPDLCCSPGVTAEKASVTSDGSGYPFKDSFPRAEALNVKGGQRCMMYPAGENFKTAEGTIQFFFKGQWKKTGHGHCVFFRLFFSDDWKKQSWGGSNSFVMQKSPKVQTLSLFQNGNAKNARIAVDLPYSTDVWHHITITWDVKKKQYALYLDGNLIGTQKFFPMTQQPVSFAIGHPLSWNAQSYIDEFRILSRALTPEEVKQDYEYLKAGNEFPSPAAAAVAKPSFEPVAVENSAAKPGETTENITFHAAAVPAVKMTGKMSDPAWKKAALLPPMVRRNGQAGLQTDCKLLYTADALYVGCKLIEPDMKNLVAQFDQNDLAIYNDDCLEIVLDPVNDPRNYYHIIVNPLGSIYDAKAGDKRWNGKGITAKTSRAADSWTVELKIPFAALSISAPEAGESWGARFVRERHHEDRGAIAVPCCKKGTYGARTYLGKLVFDSLSSEGAALKTDAPNFGMGYNVIPVTVEGAKPGMKIRTRLYNSKSSMLQEVTTELPASGKAEIALPVTDDSAVRAVLSVIAKDGTALTSATLPAETPFVAPGLIALSQKIAQLERSAGNLLTIRHPVHQGVGESIQKMKAALDAYQAKLKEACREKKRVPAAETQKILALANGFNKFQEKYQYLVWQTSPWETGSRAALPGPAEKLDPALHFTQAGNEWERTALVLSGLLCTSRLDLRIVPQLPKVKGQYVPARENFQIYYEPFLFHNGEVITGPLLKVPGNIVTVTPGEAVRVHVVFNSRGVPPGEYKAELVIKGANDLTIPERKLPVTVKVWNFTLPETHEWPFDCFFWGPNRLVHDESEVLRLEHARHINWGWTQSVQYVRGFVPYAAKHPLAKGQIFHEELVQNANQEFFETARKLKMKFIFGWGTCESIEWHRKMTARLGKMGFTKDDFIYKSMIRDEFVKKDIPQKAALREEIAKLNPGWNFQAVYLSTPPPSGATLADIEKAKLPEFFKTWTVISGLLADPKKGPRTIEFFRKHKVRLWAYRCSTSMQMQPLLEYYRFFPWFGYRKKLDGIAIWTTLSSSGPDGFDSRAGTIDGACWLDDNGKAVPTKRLEAVCEGLEDACYMHILEGELKRLKDKLPPEKEKLLKQLLNEKLDRIMVNPSQESVNSWRMEVGNAIDELSRIR